MAAVALKVGMTTSQAYLESKAVKETRALMAELCRHFYTLGWVSGTGGSITIKVHDDSIPKSQQLILMSPSGMLSSVFLPFCLCLTSSDFFCFFCHFGLVWFLGLCQILLCCGKLESLFVNLNMLDLNSTWLLPHCSMCAWMFSLGLVWINNHF